MRKHYYALLVSLVISGALAVGAGICVKANLPAEYAYYQKHSAVALPFVLMADGRLTEVLDIQLAAVLPETEPTQVTAALEATSATEPSAMPTQAPTELTTEQVTQAASEPQDTIADTTRLPTETEATGETVPPTEPVVPVEDSYFDSTLFIGDSRMCGLRDFARMGHADYFCDVGMTVFNLWERSATDYDYGTMKLENLLGYISYEKVYIALGINEAGYPMKNFESEFANLIQTVRQKQPEAIIILQSVMAVTEAYADGRSYFMPDHLTLMNEYIASFADGETVFYIDVNEAVTDEKGFLLSDMTMDGCHLYAKDVDIWVDWMKREVP